MSENSCEVLELLRSRGRDQAFAQLLPQYERKIYRLCCALLRDPVQAQDAAQESLVRIWKALPSYNGRASLSSWIYAITRNRCLTAIERRSAQAVSSDSERELEALPAELSSQPPDAHESDERSERLRELIELLPERYRQTLVLFYFEERSVTEVAAQLGAPEGTVKTLLFRARAALAERLRERGWESL